MTIRNMSIIAKKLRADVSDTADELPEAMTAVLRRLAEVAATPVPLSSIPKPLADVVANGALPRLPE